MKIITLGDHPRQMFTALLLISIVIFGQGYRAVVSADTTTCPTGMSQLDCSAIYGNWVNWVPDDGSAASCTSSTLTGTDSESKIWNFLIGKGLTAVQAAGVMGNMQAESGFVPTRHQGTGNVFTSVYLEAWGLAQWDGGRRFSPPDGGILGSLQKNAPDLVKYTDVSYDTVRNPNAVIPPADADALLSFELNYLVTESTARQVTASGFGRADNEWDTLKLQKTVNDATVFWHNNFEVSGDSAAQVIQTRGGFAQDIYTKYSGTTPTTGASSTGSSTCADPTGLTATLLAFAWPDYKGQGFIQKMPAYATAIEKSEANGMYVGYDGIDCGGFITTLMIDSGYEPKYNYDGKSSEGAGNTPVQETWLKANWSDLGPSASINVGDLKPGDVAVNGDHTFVWVGDVPGFNAKIASASGGGDGDPTNRAPMADTAQSPIDPGFEWFRKK